MTHILQKPDAIFFDWDGTLVDSLPALNGYYNHVLNAFSKPPITIEQAKSNIRRSARDVFPEVFGEQAEEALAVFYDYVAQKHLEHLMPFSGSHAWAAFRPVTNGINHREIFGEQRFVFDNACFRTEGFGDHQSGISKCLWSQSVRRQIDQIAHEVNRLSH